MDAKKRIALVADATFAALTGIVQDGEYKRRLNDAHGISKSLARAVLNVDDFDELIADLRQVLFIYTVPKAPDRSDHATVETPAVSMADIVSSPRNGGAA
jgi:hypothetical protein